MKVLAFLVGFVTIFILSTSGELTTPLAGISAVQTSDLEVSFRFSTEPPIIEEMDFDRTDIPFNQIQLKGCQHLSTSVGYPDLPQAEVMLGIPQTGNIVLSVKPGNVQIFRNVNIAPIPKQSWDSTIFKKSEAYQENRLFPGPLAEIKEEGFWRDIRVAKILISPAQYNPVTKELKVFENLDIRLRFTERPSTQSETRIQNSEVFDRIYEKILLNGNNAKNWKIEPSVRVQRTRSKERFPQVPSFLQRNFFEISENWLKVKIETTGVYKITYQDLNRLGINPNLVSPQTFRLFNIGSYITNNQYPDSMIEIPIYVYGEADSSFDPQDYILFWGEGTSGWDSTHQKYVTNLFTNYNYYWLTYGGQPGHRIESVNSSNGLNPLLLESAKRKIHFEQDLLCPARSGLLWLWHHLAKNREKPDTSLEIAFTLPNVDSLTRLIFAAYIYQPETLIGNLNIYLNQTLIKTKQFRRISQYSSSTISLETLPSVLTEDNILRIQITGPTEMQLYIDNFEVEYRQKLNLSRDNLDFMLDTGEVKVVVKGVHQTPFIFDVTDKYEPKWLSDFNLTGDSLRFQFTNFSQRYYHITDSRKVLKPISIERRRPGKLKVETPADYYIICPDELYDAATLLARYRTNNITGIIQARAKAVKLSDVYDEYTFGIEEPGAIREFFKSKQPIYGLLLGDATYDYRNNLGFTDFPVLPAYEEGFGFDPDVYTTEPTIALDFFYAQFDTDDFPDMILARATCRTNQEVRQFCNKVREYEAKPYGFWNGKILLLADDDLKGLDSQGNPKPDEIRMSEHINPCEHVAAIFKKRLEPVKVYLTEYPLAPGNEYAKPLARASFIRALNQGALLLAYFGHGAGWQLAHEKAFYVEEDVVKVNNERRNPFAFFGSCGVGRFEDTRYQSIAEELVRIEDGAIGTVGATKGTGTGGNLAFANAMFGYINDTTPATIGEAFFAAWHLDIKYHLFGDPALVLNLPELKQPLKINPDTFKLGGMCSVSDSISSAPANYYLTAYGPKWLRTYVSRFPYHGTINYVIPGFEFFRGTGSITQPKIEIPFFIPRGQGPNMRGDGYQEITNSAKVYLGIGKGQNYYCFVKDSIPISYDTLPRNDSIGPVVNLYADQQLIRDGSFVPPQFTLSGTISDPSGILVLPNTISGCSLNFYEPTSGKPVGLGQYFFYSNNSYTQGQFIYPEPIMLKSFDTLVVTAYDCQLNRTEKRVGVSVLDVGLKISNLLVYPNPVKANTYFTFTLSKPGYVRINIYTINGRPVKSISERFYTFGYNQIEWDGRDDMGTMPANGVYLYQIKARVLESSGQEFSSTITDKLLILR
jgi:hypothetical protein